MLVVSSCLESKKTEPIETDKALIRYSRGKSPKHHPTFDLWIFDDGKVLYNGIENVSKVGIYRTNLRPKQLEQIEGLLDITNKHEAEPLSGRDLPLTLLKFKDKKLIFKDTKTKGNLLKVNRLIRDVMLTL